MASERRGFPGFADGDPRAKLTFPMDAAAIMACIPHRHPFLLIDRILEATPNERIVATKAVSFTDPAFAGHFPGNPVMPGVLMVEAIAQAAGVLGHLSYEQGLSVCYLTEVSNARFRRQVIPGDVLRFDVKVLKRRPPFFWFDAVATVDGETALEVKLSAFIK